MLFFINFNAILFYPCFSIKLFTLSYSQILFILSFILFFTSCVFTLSILYLQFIFCRISPSLIPLGNLFFSISSIFPVFLFSKTAISPSNLSTENSSTASSFCASSISSLFILEPLLILISLAFSTVFSIVSFIASPKSVSYTHLTLPTNSRV